MYLFSLTEQVRPGIAINREDTPSIDTPEGCSVVVMLDRELTEFVERLPPGVPWLKRAGIVFEKGVMVLKRERGHPQQQALVHIQTAGGVSGRVFMTSNVFSEKLEHGRVVQQYNEFPPVGVEPLCQAGYSDKLLFEGIEMLDMLVVMNPGSSFRLQRDGQLEGASPHMFVRWNGRGELRCTRPRKYDFAELGQRFGATAAMA